MREECKNCGLCKNTEIESFEGDFIELVDEAKHPNALDENNTN